MVWQGVACLGEGTLRGLNGDRSTLGREGFVREIKKEKKKEEKEKERDPMVRSKTPINIQLHN